MLTLGFFFSLSSDACNRLFSFSFHVGFLILQSFGDFFKCGQLSRVSESRSSDLECWPMLPQAFENSHFFEVEIFDEKEGGVYQVYI